MAAEGILITLVESVDTAALEADAETEIDGPGILIPDVAERNLSGWEFGENPYMAVVFLFAFDVAAIARDVSGFTDARDAKALTIPKAFHAPAIEKGFFTDHGVAQDAAFGIAHWPQRSPSFWQLLYLDIWRIVRIVVGEMDYFEGGIIDDAIFDLTSAHGVAKRVNQWQVARFFEQDRSWAGIGIDGQKMMDRGWNRFAGVFEILQFAAEVMPAETTEHDLARLRAGDVFDGSDDRVHFSLADIVRAGY